MMSEKIRKLLKNALLAAFLLFFISNAMAETMPLDPDLENNVYADLPEQAQEAALTSDQILTVEYFPKNKSGVLSFYQKADDGRWFLKIDSASARLGRNGIGKAQEGDGKTPSGTYNLMQPFGILDDPGTMLGEYVKVTKDHYWCSNSESVYYNRLVDASLETDFKPLIGIDEKLIGINEYRYAIFIDYNAEGTPDRGSAIFLHCKGGKSRTSGCIAVDFDVMEFLMKTLKPGAKIVIY